MAKKKKWIQEADIEAGALRKQLGIAEGKTIPTKLLVIKPSDSPTTRKRKVLAKTFKKLARKKG